MPIKNGERRICLTQKEAMEIYSHKLQLINPTSYKASIQSWKKNVRGESSKLAKIYGVSSKTIRDIWNRKSWSIATKGLWRQESIEQVPNLTCVPRSNFKRDVLENTTECFLMQQSLKEVYTSMKCIPPNDIIYLDSTSCLLYTSPSPRDRTRSRMPSSA